MIGTASDARWHDAPKGEVHVPLGTVFRTVRDENGCQFSADEYHLGLYRASDAPALRGQSMRDYEYGPATTPYNVCRSATDTLTSKTSKHRPLPQVMTKRGNWKNQKRARKQTQFVEGTFYQQRFFEEHWPDIIRDALIFNRGHIKIYTDREDIVTERVHPWEVFTDPVDAHYGKPRNVYHCRSIDRGVALATWARNADGKVNARLRDAIMKAGRFETWRDYDTERTSTVDRVDIIEAWHLPSRKKAKDGRHVVIVQGATLIDEVWEHDYFPFVTLYYSRPVVGDKGTGLIESLEGYQYDINLAAEKSTEQHMMSGVGILVPDNAGIHDQQIRNGITTIYHRPGGEPKVWQMDLVNEHTRQRPRELVQDALNDAGLSQLSVQSQKPAGITSGVALQNLDDFETERFMTFGRATHYLCVEVARRYIDCAKQIANDYGDMAVSVPMRGGLLDLKWNDVSLDEIELKVFNSSLLKEQPAARLEQLKDLFNSQIIGRGEFLRYLDAPDLQTELDTETADLLVVDEMIERMLDAEEEEGESAFMAPSAYQNLEWAAKRAQQRYNRALLDGAPEFNLELLRRFIKQCQVEMQKMPAAAPPGAPGMPQNPDQAAPAPTDMPNLGIQGPPIAA